MAVVALLAAAAAVVAAALAPREIVIAAYATTLDGRSPAQRANALRSADAFSGTLLQPGEVFSFNKAVGSLSVDRGYLKAAVSYDGELLPSFGGGVCQTSTTLYNAALQAGLEITERERHFWPPRYAEPGADAAVAYPTYDLAFRNTLDQPVRLVVLRKGKHLVCQVLAGRRPDERYEVTRRLQSVEPAAHVRRPSERLATGQSRLQVRGQNGFSVTTYRVTYRGAQACRRELIARDSYPPLNELRQVGTHISCGVSAAASLTGGG